MAGSMRERAPGKWELRASIGRRDPVTGAYRYKSRTFKGTEPGARKALARLVTEVSDGRHADASSTFGELLDDWLAEKATLSPTTLNEYRRIVRCHLKPTLGKVRLDKLTVKQFSDLWQALLGRGLAPQSIDHVRAVARAALNQAVTWELLITSNPAAKAKGPPVPRAELHPPDLVELGRIVAEAKATEPEMAIVLGVAAGVGCRRGELCGLRWRDVDLQAGAVRIHRAVVEVNGHVIVKDTKTHQERTVPIDEVTQGLLVGLRIVLEQRAERFGLSLDQHAFVFSREPDCARPMRPEWLTGAFRSARRKAGVPHARLHDLRHLNAKLLLEAGVPLAEVSYRLGHAKQSTTTDVYNRYLPGSEGAAPKVLAGLLGPVLE